MRALGIFAVSLFLSVASLAAQQAAPTLEERAISGWKTVHKKVLDMAGDFPEELYDSRPHPDSRSFVEEIQHVTIGAEMFAAQLSGGQFDYGERVKFYSERETTRAVLVVDLERAIDAVVGLLAGEKEAENRQGLAYWLGHQSEHYGKLTAIYRINNLVPPATVQLMERFRRQREQQEQ